MTKCCVYEIRSNVEMSCDEYKNLLKKWAKKWVFQKEKGDSGYIHYQGRISLIKKREPEVLKNVLRRAGDLDCFQFIAPTTTAEHQKEAFYATKEDTRIEGPFSDLDEERYIPRQIREIENLRPFQQTIIEKANDWDTRSINIIYCEHGNMGKSILVGYLRAYGIARALPPVNDYKDLLRMVCDLPTSRCYLFDMPRSLNKDRLYQFFSAVETIKDGYAYDDRYQFKEKVFDCPNIWIFTNTMPDFNMLSLDRWKLWTIDNEFNLVKKGFKEEIIYMDEENIPTQTD